jgi:ankyrin repeat protein
MLLQGQAREMVAAPLWKLGVEPIQDKIGQTPLHAPAREGDSDVVGLLLIKVVSKVSEPHPIDRCGAKWQSQCRSDNNQYLIKAKFGSGG